METSSALSDLRQTLTELRVTYHRALARRLGRKPAAESDLRRFIALEPGEPGVIALISAQRRLLAGWAGLGGCGHCFPFLRGGTEIIYRAVDQRP